MTFNSRKPTIVSVHLRCPRCRVFHVDTGIWAVKAHHTHLCLFCGREFDADAGMRRPEDGDRSLVHRDAYVRGAKPTRLRDRIADLCCRVLVKLASRSLNRRSNPKGKS